jgi:hypothetical protein
VPLRALRTLIALDWPGRTATRAEVRPQLSSCFGPSGAEVTAMTSWASRGPRQLPSVSSDVASANLGSDCRHCCNQVGLILNKVALGPPRTLPLRGCSACWWRNSVFDPDEATWAPVQTSHSAGTVAVAAMASRHRAVGGVDRVLQPGGVAARMQLDHWGTRALSQTQAEE